MGLGRGPLQRADPSRREIAQAPPDGLDNELTAYDWGKPDKPLPNPAREQQQNPWEIGWRLKKASPRGGHIVQTVTHTTPSGKTYTYSEAWEVKPGQDRPTMENQNQPHDTFQVQQSAVPGVHKLRSEARFYEGLLLPGDFKSGSVPEARGLPATERDPGLSTVNATAPFVREWDMEP